MQVQCFVIDVTFFPPSLLLIQLFDLQPLLLNFETDAHANTHSRRKNTLQKPKLFKLNSNIIQSHSRLLNLGEFADSCDHAACETFALTMGSCLCRGLSCFASLICNGCNMQETARGRFRFPLVQTWMLDDACEVDMPAWSSLDDECETEGCALQALQRRGLISKMFWARNRICETVYVLVVVVVAADLTHRQSVLCCCGTPNSPARGQSKLLAWILGVGICEFLAI